MEYLHTMIRVTDLKATIAFFELMGFAETRRIENEKARYTLVFLAALLSAWAHGLDISCGCFGKENNATNFPKHIAEDGALLAGLALAWWLECRMPPRIAKSKSVPAL